MKRLFIVLILLIPSLSRAQFADWSDFLGQVNAHSTVAQKDSVVQAFIDYATGTTGIPYIEDNHAYFVYFNPASTPAQANVAGDFNGWNPNAASMTRLQPTHLFYTMRTFEMDARLDYKFVLDGNWILDPRNPHTCPGGFGANSELAMPDYVQPPEILEYPDYQHGNVNTTYTIVSGLMGQTFHYYVYTPPGYNENTDRDYPALYLLDGQEYRSFAHIDNIADYLINNDLTRDMILIMQVPNNRENEYVLNDTFVNFLADELVPVIDAGFRTIDSPASRGMAGVSYGGLCATYTCYLRPDIFGMCAAQSPAYWPNNNLILSLLATNGFDPDIPVYMDWGTYEPSIQLTGIMARDWFMANGNAVAAFEYPEGHSWGQWRAHIDDALKMFFPPATALEPVEQNERVSMTCNYPNPFSKSTRIAFSLPTNDRVEVTIYNIAGQLIEQRQPLILPAGNHEFSFDGTTLPPGQYFFELQTSTAAHRHKMTVIR